MELSDKYINWLNAVMAKGKPAKRAIIGPISARAFISHGIRETYSGGFGNSAQRRKRRRYFERQAAAIRWLAEQPEDSLERICITTFYPR